MWGESSPREVAAELGDRVLDMPGPAPRPPRSHGCIRRSTRTGVELDLLVRRREGMQIAAAAVRDPSDRAAERHLDVGDSPAAQALRAEVASSSSTTSTANCASRTPPVVGPPAVGQSACDAGRHS